MKHLTNVIRRVTATFGRRALDYYDREPVRVHAALTALLLGAAALLGLVLDSAVVAVVVAALVPVVVGAVREEVTPPAAVKARQYELGSLEPEDLTHDDPHPANPDAGVHVNPDRQK